MRAGVALAALGIVVVTATSAIDWFAQRPGPTLQAPVAIGWPEGLSAEEAAQLLADLGLVSHSSTVELYFRTTRASACFAPGAHLLPRRASPAELRSLLCRSAERPRVKLTIPEGFNRFAVAERMQRLGIVSREAFLHVSSDERTLAELEVDVAPWAPALTAEGYLFPASYRFPLDSDPELVLRRLVRETFRRWGRLAAAHGEALEELQEELGWGRREVLTLASMVEKEVSVAAERPLVASVFFNRLRDPSFEPKLLQSDPTAVYGCHAMPAQIAACVGFDGRATPALNRDPHNRYSTYVHPGLPPGPIANPGEAAVEAVLAPASSAYLYFVATGDGRHVFSKSFEAHRDAIGRLRRRRR